jgi:S-formylglutathione hydrolase FrmB
MARNWFTALAFLFAFVSPLAAQPPSPVKPVVPDPVAGAKPVTVERIKIHGTALEGNLEGDAVDRGVIVYLPPSYASDPSRRYPVVYALHGYSIGNEKWTTEIHTPQTVEGAFATGTREMIVVLPDAQTLHNGSMYSNSVTTGDWEDFIAHDVVAYIDSHYRTIPNRLSRGLAGHSMGGYGTSRIGMKHPEMFGALYIMSPCCMSARTTIEPELAQQLESVKAPEDSAKLTFFSRAALASAAAWSPNPKNPPLYLDLPTKDGMVQPEVLARWAANAPLAMVHQYIPNLRQYRAIAIDVGDQDRLKTDAGIFHDTLESYGIVNSFEIYSGTHTSAVADRMQNHVLPFFSANLNFAQ